MKHPIKVISYIPAQLSANKAIRRRQHIMIPWSAWTGIIKKANRTFGRGWNILSHIASS